MVFFSDPARLLSCHTLIPLSELGFSLQPTYCWSQMTVPSVIVSCKFCIHLTICPLPISTGTSLSVDPAEFLSYSEKPLLFLGGFSMNGLEFYLLNSSWIQTIFPNTTDSFYLVHNCLLPRLPQILQKCSPFFQPCFFSNLLSMQYFWLKSYCITPLLKTLQKLLE